MTFGDINNVFLVFVLYNVQLQDIFFLYFAPAVGVLYTTPTHANIFRHIAKLANLPIWNKFVKENSRLLLSSYSVYLVSDLGPVSLDVSCQRDSLARKRWKQNKGALGHELFKSSFVPRVKEGQLSVLGYYFKHIKWRDTGTRIRTRVVVNSERCATTELLVLTSIDKLL